jgi:MFS family permease
LVGQILASLLLFSLGFTSHFVLALILIAGWAVTSASLLPVRQSFLNQLIPSKQRATVLSFDSMLGSTGGVIFQPALGKAADVWSYSASYMIGGLLSAFAWPFLILAGRQKTAADLIASRASEEK